MNANQIFLKFRFAHFALIRGPLVFICDHLRKSAADVFLIRENQSNQCYQW